jgi:hypothetical protein
LATASVCVALGECPSLALSYERLAQHRPGACLCGR